LTWSSNLVSMSLLQDNAATIIPQTINGNAHRQRLTAPP
jgi:hypothetical protein